MRGEIRLTIVSYSCYGLNRVLPKFICESLIPPVPQNVTLFRIVIADVIKMDWYWSRVGPWSGMTSVLVKWGNWEREGERERDRERERERENAMWRDGGRGQSDAAEAKGSQRLPVNFQKLGQQPGTGSLSRCSEGANTDDTLVSDSSSPDCETINFCCLSCLVRGTFYSNPTN